MSSKHLEKEILAFLRKTLTAERLHHVGKVTLLAERLARKHDLDPARARLAGLLHDAARCWSDSELIRYAKKHKLRVPEPDFVRLHAPVLLHSYVGADMARKDFAIRDREVLSAIANHSLGAPGMARLDKILYLADLLSYDRKFTGVHRLRRLAFRNLEQAFLEGMKSKLLYLARSESVIHPECVRLWNHSVAK